jgi:hypothetical protein
VTSGGIEWKEIAAVREELIDYIKDNLYISGQKWRTDLGWRVEEFEKEITSTAPKIQQIQRLKRSTSPGVLGDV